MAKNQVAGREWGLYEEIMQKMQQFANISGRQRV
jgi:hypothetical protein